MVRAMLGSEVGVTSRDKSNETMLGAVVSVTANNFVVSAADFRNFKVGQIIDLLVAATGSATGGAAGRTVTGANSATNTITYSGADIATLDNTFAAYLTGQWEPVTPTVVNGVSRDGYANLNGGPGPYSGFDHPAFGSIQQMRDRLTAISGTTYSSAQLDLMTYNDLVYAIRVNDASGTI